MHRTKKTKKKPPIKKKTIEIPTPLTLYYFSFFRLSPLPRGKRAFFLQPTTNQKPTRRTILYRKT